MFRFYFHVCLFQFSFAPLSFFIIALPSVFSSLPHFRDFFSEILLGFLWKYFHFVLDDSFCCVQFLKFNIYSSHHVQHIIPLSLIYIIAVEKFTLTTTVFHWWPVSLFTFSQFVISGLQFYVYRHGFLFIYSDSFFFNFLFN